MPTLITRTDTVQISRATSDQSEKTSKDGSSTNSIDDTDPTNQNSDNASSLFTATSNQLHHNDTNQNDSHSPHHSPTQSMIFFTLDAYLDTIDTRSDTLSPTSKTFSRL